MAKKVSSTKKAPANNYLANLEQEIQTNQSKISLVLGALIVLVIGILVFNYFNRNKASLGPAQQTEVSQKEDVAPDQLPGKYTVKEGDTLFLIADKYYQDGSKFTEIAKTNNLASADQIEAGQTLDIPKLEPEPVREAQASPQPSSSTEPAQEQSLGIGGGNSTIWGDKIDGNTYTVIEGDWLSTIAARAYGDIMAFDRIAEANNISNPDQIEPGLVLKLPR